MKKAKIEITGQTPDVERVEEKIDLNILGKTDEQIAAEIDKSDVNTAFVAVIAQLEKAGRSDEAAALNRKFARVGEHQIAQRTELLKPYAGLLE